MVKHLQDITIKQKVLFEISTYNNDDNTYQADVRFLNGEVLKRFDAITQNLAIAMAKDFIETINDY